MQLTTEEIEKAFQIGGAAVGGGALWKIIDILIGHRKRKVDNDSVAIDSAVKLVQALNGDIERLKEDVKSAQEERKICTDKYEEQRIVVTDLKIALRSFYEHMRDHLKTCDHPSELPPLPESLVE